MFYCRSLVLPVALAVPLFMLQVGCSSGDQFSTAPVSGTVTSDGKPIPGGSVTFSPTATGTKDHAGKPASGTIQEDGTYTLTTYSDGDGAVIGKHTISFTPPATEVAAAPAGGHAAAPPPSPYAGMVPKQPEVEVIPGSNSMNIELVKAGR